MTVGKQVLEELGLTRQESGYQRRICNHDTRQQLCWNVWVLQTWFWKKRQECLEDHPEVSRNCRSVWTDPSPMELPYEPLVSIFLLSKSWRTWGLSASWENISRLESQAEEARSQEIGILLTCFDMEWEEDGIEGKHSQPTISPASSSIDLLSELACHEEPFPDHFQSLSRASQFRQTLLHWHEVSQCPDTCPECFLEEAKAREVTSRRIGRCFRFLRCTRSQLPTCDRTKNLTTSWSGLIWSSFVDEQVVQTYWWPQTRSKQVNGLSVE